MLLMHWDFIAGRFQGEGGRGAGLKVKALVFVITIDCCTKFSASLKNVEIEFELISASIKKYLMA